MKTKPSYTEIASNYSLWIEYADPSGYDSEAQFNAKTTADKIAFLVSCFGEESYTAEEIALEDKLSNAANEEGTIQAEDMLHLAPHHRPELHATMSVGAAFEAITGKDYDADFFCR